MNSNTSREAVEHALVRPLRRRPCVCVVSPLAQRLSLSGPWVNLPIESTVADWLILVNRHAQLGYEPVVGDLRALHSGIVPNSWRPIGDDIERDYRRCANFDSPVGCNWLVAAEDPVDLCMACRLNRTIPDLPKAISTKLNRRLLAASAAPPVFKKRLRFILLMD